jgi:hypothetical protein
MLRADYPGVLERFQCFREPGGDDIVITDYYKIMKLLLYPSRTFASAATSLFLVFSAGQTFAEFLIENTSVALSGTTSALRPELAGTIIEDRVRPFSLTLPTGGLITGSIQDRVVRQDGAGTLDFYWRVLSDTSSAGDLAYFRIGNFVPNPYVFDANYRTDGSGDVPASAAFLFGGVHAGQGYVNFAVTISPGQSSLFMFLSTSATEYGDVAAMDVATPGTTEASNLLSTFAPALVPEPSALALFGLSALTFVGLRRRNGAQS